jgi:hypothetical protein
VSVIADTPAVLRERAAAVLRGNDAGGWTKASPHLYPHQWSWDSAFVAIGWAHLDVRRAMTELGLLWHSLCQLGYFGRADEIRRDSLSAVAAGGEFAEYFDPCTGESLGSPRQSWTAAVVLDWLAAI